MLRSQTIDIPQRPAARPAMPARQEPVSLAVETDLDAVAETWRAFEREADGTVFQSFLWQSAWLRHIGARRNLTPAIVTGRGDDGGLLFLFPLAVEPAGPVRRLTWLASELCDYNGPLLAPDFASRIPTAHFVALWREIGRLLQADPRLRHDAAVLEKMPGEVGAQANPFLALGATLNPSGAYLTRLSADFDAFYEAKRSPARRKSDRWKRRRLADQGEVRFVTAAAGEDVVRTLDTLFAQKARSFAAMGVADIFANPGQADFYRDVATAAGTAVHVSRLEVGTASAAANMGLMFRGRYYHVLASYCDGEIARFGPGAVHLQHLLRYAVEHGCTLFDFTIGDEPYKREWSDVELALHDVRHATTPLGLAVALPSLAVARAKRLVKQTPALWWVARKLRGLVGRTTARHRAGHDDAPSDSAD